MKHYLWIERESIHLFPNCSGFPARFPCMCALAAFLRRMFITYKVKTRRTVSHTAPVLLSDNVGESVHAMNQSRVHPSAGQVRTWPGLILMAGMSRRTGPHNEGKFRLVPRFAGPCISCTTLYQIKVCFDLKLKNFGKMNADPNACSS